MQKYLFQILTFHGSMVIVNAKVLTGPATLNNEKKQKRRSTQK